MRLYLKATGINRWAGGSSRWLKVRKIARTAEDTYELWVEIRGKEMFVELGDYARKIGTPVIYRVGKWPKTKPCDIEAAFNICKQFKTY